MTATLLHGPALEPVSLADAKAHLRLDGDADDPLIRAGIVGARVHVEAATGHKLIAQRWRCYRDGWPADRVMIVPVAPLLSVEAVTAFGADGTPQVLPAAAYGVWPGAAGRIVLKRAVLPPEASNGLEIDVTAGFGPTSLAVPAPLRQAILLLVAHWYAHRGAAGFDRAGDLVPPEVEERLARFRRPAIGEAA